MFWTQMSCRRQTRNQLQQLEFEALSAVRLPRDKLLAATTEATQAYSTANRAWR